MNLQHPGSTCQPLAKMCFPICTPVLSPGSSQDSEFLEGRIQCGPNSGNILVPVVTPGHSLWCPPFGPKFHSTYLFPSFGHGSLKLQTRASPLIHTRVTSLASGPWHQSCLKLPGNANVQPELRPTRGRFLEDRLVYNSSLRPQNLPGHNVEANV